MQGKNAVNEAMDGYVHSFDAWCHGAQSASEQSQLCELSWPTFGFTMQEFSMEGGYMKNPKKNKTVKIGVWALSRDNTVSCFVFYWSPTLLRH